MRLVLSAEDAAGIQTLRGLKARGHTVVAVMAAPTDGRARPGSTVWDVAGAQGHQRWPARRLGDPALADDLVAHGVDLLLNVHSLVIVHPAILEVLPLGAYNLHPSLLPRYAGLDSVSWAIHHGEPESGVTVHRMEAGLDTGPIAFQSRIPIGPDDTGLSVSTRCVSEGVRLMLQLADLAATDPAGIPAVEQDLGQRTCFGRRGPHDGIVPWDASARQVHDFVRACDYRPFASSWGHPRTEHHGREVRIVRTARTRERADAVPGTIGRREGDGVRVACADQWLIVRNVAIDGAPMPPAATLAPGSRLGTPIGQR